MFVNVYKRSATGFHVHCPAHDDPNPSLHINEGPEGQVLLHCFAGCSYNEVTEAMQQFGVNQYDLWVQADEYNDDGTPTRVPFTNYTTSYSSTSERKSKPLGRIVDTYDYYDENGGLLFQTVRYEPKDFRQRRPRKPVKRGERPDPGGWIWNLDNLDGVVPPLYFQDLVLAYKHKQTVYVVEGEKDVHALYDWGKTATTAPMGASTQWYSSYTQVLSGANVVIVADKDDAGRKRAFKIAKELEPVCPSVKVVEARKGNDAYDHLQAGHSPDEFVEVV
jgi:5S rRNA maturation endonuclease (ribonuclease M5)